MLAEKTIRSELMASFRDAGVVHKWLIRGAILCLGGQGGNSATHKCLTMGWILMADRRSSFCILTNQATTRYNASMQVTPTQASILMNHVEEYQRRLTYKGTVTIPAEVRRVLGVQPHGEVRFRVAEGRVELLPPTMTLEAAFGSVEPRKRPENFQELREKAMAEHVRAVVASQKG